MGKQIYIEEIDAYLPDKLKEDIDICVDDVINGEMDCVIIIDGKEGCLSGDTEIQLSRCKFSRKFTIERLYNAYNNNIMNLRYYKKWDLSIPNYIRAYNGKEIKLHKIKNVVYSGEKQLYLLKLANGNAIKATADHKIMTKCGWVELQNLKPNDLVMCDTLKAEKLKRKRVKLKDVALKVYFHPYKNVRQEVEVHRLIYESRLNNIHFLKYLDLLLNEEEECKRLKYIDPNIYHIHHKDGCHYNNSIDNLILLTKVEHLKLHAENSYQNFSQGIPKFSEVISVTKVEIERTYDIQCEDPYHNFVANGIVVHNSGKSYDARLIAKYISTITKTPFGVDNIHFSTDKYISFSESKPKFTINVLDESREALNKKRGMSKSNIGFTNWLSENRDKQQIHIIVLPAIHDLDSYISIWRMKLLIHKLLGHVRSGSSRSGYKLKRGFFRVYENTNNLQQVMFNKQRYGYYAYPQKYKYQRMIRFSEVFTKEELKTYKEKKARERKAKYDGSNNAKADKYKNAIYNLNKKGNMSQEEIARIVGISSTLVGNICREISKNVTTTKKD